MKCLHIFVYVSLLVGLQSVLCNKHIPRSASKSHNLNVNSVEPGRNDFSFAVAIIWIYMNEYLSLEGEAISAKTKYYCTGNIVSPSWVLTAAQCFQRLVDDRAVLGKHMNGPLVPYGGTVHIGEEWIIIKEIHVYPEYNEASPKDIDLALLKLAVDFQIPHPGHKSSVAVFAEHFPADSDMKKPADLKKCWVIGFGKYNRGAKYDFVKKLRGYPATAGGNAYCGYLLETLDKTNVSYAPFYSCALGEVNKESPQKVTRGMTCVGDVGGGLVCGGKLTGITSQRWETEMCGGDNAFTSFISVGHPDVLEWIKTLVKPAPVVKANDAADAEEGRVESRDDSAADSTSSQRQYIAVVVALGAVALIHVQ